MVASILVFRFRCLVLSSVPPRQDTPIRLLQNALILTTHRRVCSGHSPRTKKIRKIKHRTSLYLGGGPCGKECCSDHGGGPGNPTETGLVEAPSRRLSDDCLPVLSPLLSLELSPRRGSSLGTWCSVDELVLSWDLST